MLNSSSSSILQQIISSYPKPSSIRIKDKSIVEDKVFCIVSGGPSALQLITDFDATLTRYHLDRRKCDSSYGIIANSPLIPEALHTKAQELYRKYYPIEVHPNMTIEEKIPLMIEWYEKSHEYMVEAEPRISKACILEMVKLSSSHLRDNAKTVVERMSKAGIPLLILSAGVGDIVEGVLARSAIDLDNVKVISNFMAFDDTGYITGFKEPLIHMYNKNEAAVHDHNSQYFLDLSLRTNVILLGDSLGDVNMDHGVAEPKTVLKIGFLNAQIDEHLDAYMAAFDIVLVDDQSFDFVNLILDHVFQLVNS